MGPVQVLVVGFEQPTFRGEVLAELARLGEAGIVRLIDVLVVSRVDDGTFETVDLPPGMPAGLGEVTAALLGRADAEDLDADGPGNAELPTHSSWSLADSLPVGVTAAVALIEHVWAGPLREGMRRAGAVPLDETWLAPADLDALETLTGQRER